MFVQNHEQIYFLRCVFSTKRLTVY